MPFGLQPPHQVELALRKNLGLRVQRSERETLLTELHSTSRSSNKLTHHDVLDSKLPGDDVGSAAIVARAHPHLNSHLVQQRHCRDEEGQRTDNARGAGRASQTCSTHEPCVGFGDIGKA
jgi:hypothetical protein